jgi:16S rRNA (uracil1498-N3)-methyltransferase
MEYNNIQYFYVDPDTVTGDSFSITGEEFHHAARVLRAVSGGTIAAVDGKGNEYLGEISEVIRGKEILCRIIKTRRRPNEPINTIVLMQALIKGDRFDYIVEKSVELGVAKFIPVNTQRGVVKGNEHKIKRWRTIAKTAMKQSGRSVLPEITDIMDFNDAIEHLLKVISVHPTEKLLLHKNSQTTFAAYLEKAAVSGLARTYIVAVGPEGDFTPEEIQIAKDNAFKPVSFGPRRLRSETAGIAALSALMLHER